MNSNGYMVSRSGVLHRAGRCYGARTDYDEKLVRRVCKVCLPHGAVIRTY